MISINKNRLMEFMEFRRWNKTDLAAAMNFSETYISRILSGEREPSREFMDRLSGVSGLSLGELFFSSQMYQNVSNSKNRLPLGTSDELETVRPDGLPEDKCLAVGPGAREIANVLPKLSSI